MIAQALQRERTAVPTSIIGIWFAIIDIDEFSVEIIIGTEAFPATALPTYALGFIRCINIYPFTHGLLVLRFLLLAKTTKNATNARLGHFNIIGTSKCSCLRIAFFIDRIISIFDVVVLGNILFTEFSADIGKGARISCRTRRRSE